MQESNQRPNTIAAELAAGHFHWLPPYSGPFYNFSPIYFILFQVFFFCLFVTWSAPHNSSVKSIAEREILWCSRGRQGIQDARVVGDLSWGIWAELSPSPRWGKWARRCRLALLPCLTPSIGPYHSYGYPLSSLGHLSPYLYLVKYKLGGCLAESSFHMWQPLNHPTFLPPHGHMPSHKTEGTQKWRVVVLGVPTLPLLLWPFGPDKQDQ